MSFVTPSPARGRWETARSLDDRIKSAGYALMAYWYYRWDWGEGAAFDGLERAARALAWDAGLKFAENELEAELGRWREGGEANPFAPCRAMLRLHDRLPEQDVDGYLAAVCAELLSRDQPTRLFVDSLYFEITLLVEVGIAQADEKLVTHGVDKALQHLRLLQSERDGLLRHFAEHGSGASPSVYWGRGNGWGMLGLTDLLLALPAEVEGRAELLQRYRALAEALLDRQAPTGAWRNIVDVEPSFAESSTTALVVTGLQEGAAGGLLPVGAAAAAERGWQAIGNEIDASGHLRGVSLRPGLHSEGARYEHVPTGGVFPWGNGPYLRAAVLRLPAEPVA